MNILWLSNSPFSSGGYGVQTKMVVPRLQKLGHRISVMCTCGIQGATMLWQDGIKLHGIPFFQKGAFDQEMLLMHGDEIEADVVISFLDLGSLDSKKIMPRWIPWYPVDREPMSIASRRSIQYAYESIACSEFGFKEAQNFEINSKYIPCAIDSKVFFPGDDRGQARRNINCPEDVFLVGIVADNKGYPTRKCIAQQIEAFARFHSRRPDTALYLHTTIDGSRMGLDLRVLLGHLKLDGAAYVCDQPQYKLGFSQSYMRSAYNAMDVLCAVTMDEGFGVPIIEAQACNTPVLAGGWTAMPELVGCGGIVSKDDAEPWWCPTGGYQFLPHIDAIVDGLEDAYQKRQRGGREKALEYDIERVVQTYWKPVLEDIEAGLDDRQIEAFTEEELHPVEVPA